MSCYNEDWSKSHWIKSSKTSFSFDSYKVYIVLCNDDEEAFIKIGRTYTTTESRFQSIPYVYTIIGELVFEEPEDCWNMELELHKKYEDYIYNPLKEFAGRTECFSTDCLEQIIKYLSKTYCKGK